MVDVNPDPKQDTYQFNPIERVTALLDAHERLPETVAALESAGIARDRIEVYTGEKGLRRVDPSGEESGTAGKLYRLLESWVSDTADFQVRVKEHLEHGGYIVAAHVGTDDTLKQRAMDVFAQQEARDVKYWHTLFVEQGRQEPQG